jgi:hypothetical protein
MDDAVQDPSPHSLLVVMCLPSLVEPLSEIARTAQDGYGRNLLVWSQSASMAAPLHHSSHLAFLSPSYAYFKGVCLVRESKMSTIYKECIQCMLYDCLVR